MDNNTEYCSLLQLIEENKNEIEDIKKQYIHLLSFLTKTTDVSNDHFLEQLNKIFKIGYIVVCYYKRVEDLKIFIIGSGTIIYEPKIIHGCKYAGHIEDIVVHNLYRSHGIAKEILQKLIYLAKNNDCYKIILDCKENLTAFYKKSGFQCHGTQMSMYFE
jgi:glucosamine-phosphate N-acetyltransferase